MVEHCTGRILMACHYNYTDEMENIFVLLVRTWLKFYKYNLRDLGKFIFHNFHKIMDRMATAQTIALMSLTAEIAILDRTRLASSSATGLLSHMLVKQTY